MLFSFKRALAVVALGTFASMAGFSQEKGPQWKDRAEYDLVDSIQKEQNAKTKLGLLNSWKEKYPQSEFKELRHDEYVKTYQALGDGKQMMAAAKAWLADNPKAFLGLYWMNLLTISLNDNSPGALATGEQAGKGLLGIIGETFDPAKKPQEVSEDAWKKNRSDMEAVAHRTLGWVAMQRSQNEDAERHLLEVLKRTPSDAMASFWAGTVVAKQRKLEKQSAALYHFAHAATHAGEGSLPAEQRKQTLAYLEKTYVNFHGDRGGLDEMIAMARKSPIPPDGFKIESKDEILIKQEEELKRTNPALALWINMKRELSGPNGPAYFENVKGTLFPGGVEVGETKIDRMKGSVVSSNPAARPREVVLGISSPDMSEVTLKFERPMVGSIEPGTELEFSGVPVEYSADPFMLTVEVANDDVVGWPKPAPPARKAPAKKRAKK